MKAIIAVIGHDCVGILAHIATACTAENANVIDVNQTVMQEYFAMIMLVDITDISCSFREFTERITEAGQQKEMTVHVMHENIFNSMHRI